MLEKSATRLPVAKSLYEALQEARAYAAAPENNIIYMDTSAKSGMNVRDIFVAIGPLSPAGLRRAELLAIFLSLSLSNTHSPRSLAPSFYA